MSKAATRNVAMHYAEVDLAALLKQVQYELADRAEASGIVSAGSSRGTHASGAGRAKDTAASLRTWW